MNVRLIRTSTAGWPKSGPAQGKRHKKSRKSRSRYNPHPDAAWRAAHPEFSSHMVEPRLEPDSYKMVRVTTEYYCGGAIWVKRSGVWSCLRAAPILRWMHRKTPAEVHLELIRLGADFQWLKIDRDTVRNGSPTDSSKLTRPGPEENTGLESRLIQDSTASTERGSALGSQMKASNSTEVFSSAPQPATAYLPNAADRTMAAAVL